MSIAEWFAGRRWRARNRQVRRVNRCACGQPGAYIFAAHWNMGSVAAERAFCDRHCPGCTLTFEEREGVLRLINEQCTIGGHS